MRMRMHMCTYAQALRMHMCTYAQALERLQEDGRLVRGER